VTYERGQKVVGWAEHETDGEFESVSVVPSVRGGDVVWVVVKRTLDGVVKHTLERMQRDHLKRLTDLDSGVWEDGCWLDCAKTVTSVSAINTFSGFSHLNGMTVGVLADGSPTTGVILGGNLTLQFAAKKVVVGLPYTSLMETTYIERGDSRIAKKRITSASVSVFRSMGGKVSASKGIDGSWESMRYDTLGTPMDSAQPFFTGLIDVKFESVRRNYNTITIKQDQPLPLIIKSLTTRYEADSV